MGPQAFEIDAPGEEEAIEVRSKRDPLASRLAFLSIVCFYSCNCVVNWSHDNTPS